MSAPWNAETAALSPQLQTPSPQPDTLSPQPGALSPQQEEELAAVLEGYVEEIEQGFAPDPEELIARHPGLEQPLRAHLASIRLLHRMGAECSASSGEGPADPGMAAKQLGDYQLIREIGRGGMGVVYEARQLSLDRQVAVKVLPFAALLDQKQIERFKCEARAAAQLHHPHIVPVYAVGCERGVHFYAMQLVEGQSLEEVFDQLRAARTPADATEPAGGSAPTLDARNRPTLATAPLGDSPRSPRYFRAVAECGAQAAEALHFAHEYGILHRDVKPSNLLLDRQGKTWITDFGLARLPTESRITMTGDMLGTLRYMSPEQAAGRPAALDERTDVYSLGITLYELLTLEYALDGPDRNDMLRQIAEAEPPPPRRINPAIPADLETIVLKAISKAAPSRYTSAREMADDLRRFLAGQPTLARRAGLAERASRWARRHRALVRSAAALLAVALLALTVSTLLVMRANSATRAANQQLQAANARTAAALAESEENRRRAELHFRQARHVLDAFGLRYAEQLAKVPGAERLRQQTLEDALRYYREFVAHARDDANFLRDLAVTNTKIGTIAEQLGDRPKALEAYGQAEEILRNLADGHPERQRAWADLALCYNNIGLLHLRAGQSDEAEPQFRRAIEIQERLVRQAPGETGFQEDLALSYANLGLLASQTGRPSLAFQNGEKAVRLGEALLEREPRNPRHLDSLASGYANLSQLYAASDCDQALTCCRRAVELQKELCRAKPTVAAYHSGLALSYNNLGALQSRGPAPAKARASYDEASRIQEELLHQSPTVAEYQLALAVTHNNLGQLEYTLRHWTAARQEFEQARDLLSPLVARYPQELNYRSSLGGTLNNLGMTCQQLGQADEALQAYREGVVQQRQVVQAAPQIARFRDFLAKQTANLAQAETSAVTASAVSTVPHISLKPTGQP